MPEHEQAQPLPNGEISLLELLTVPLKQKKIILTVTLAAAAAALIATFIMPKRYTATATMLPRQFQGQGLQNLVSSAGGAGALLGNFQMGDPNMDVFVGILSSRSVADEIIDRFDLKAVYRLSHRERVYQRLSENTGIEVNPRTNIISVSVEDTVAQRAAAIANAYITALDRINRNVNVTEGQRKREFLEKRLGLALVDLQQAEMELKNFQQAHKLIAVDAQARATIDGAAKIKADIIGAETELEVMKLFRTDQQAETRTLKAKINELHRQLEKIESGNMPKSDGSPDSDGPDASDSTLSLRQIPQLSMQLGRLMREVKIQENIFELLTSQFELAKIEEARDVNTIQTLDKAVPPEIHSSPRRFMIAGLTTATADVVAVLILYFLEYLCFMKKAAPESYRNFSYALTSWKLI